MKKYAGYVVFPYAQPHLVHADCDVPFVSFMGDKGERRYLHVSDDGRPEAGYWIPEEWFHDRVVQAAKEIAASNAMSTIRALQGRIDSMKEAAKRNQKTTETQAGKIRDAMAEIMRVMPWTTGPDRGLVSLVKEMVQNYSNFRTRAQDRDRYGATLSNIRKICRDAIYGADQGPDTDNDTTTTHLVQAVIQMAHGSVEAVRIAREADALQINAQMSARRAFVGRLFKIYKPGIALGWVDGAHDSELDKRQEEIIAWLMERPNHAEYERMQEEFLAIRAELKSTGHQSTGKALDVLVDMAIDREREHRHEDIAIIARAIGQDWSTFKPASGVKNYTAWACHLANVIRDFWQPKPERDAISDLDLRTVGDVAERAVDREEWRDKPNQFTAGDRHWLQELEVRMSTVESKLAAVEGKRLIR